MIAGTIMVLGGVGRRLGAGMKRGTLVLPSLPAPASEVLLPSFARAGVVDTPLLKIYFRQLEEWSFPVSRAVSSALLERYNGDLVVKGQGEVLLGQQGS
jgi:formylmethanofuran dehydrogenase subunit C